ncbi:hypothetical protein Bbelb_384820, partial [Branchiostoma belcheri]
PAGTEGPQSFAASRSQGRLPPVWRGAVLPLVVVAARQVLQVGSWVAAVLRGLKPYLGSKSWTLKTGHVPAFARLPIPPDEFGSLLYKSFSCVTARCWQLTLETGYSAVFASLGPPDEFGSSLDHPCSQWGLETGDSSSLPSRAAWHMVELEVNNMSSSGREPVSPCAYIYALSRRMARRDAGLDTTSRRRLAGRGLPWSGKGEN